MHIADQETLQQVIDTLYTCRVFFLYDIPCNNEANKYHRNMPVVRLNIAGINNFDRGRVLWAGVKKDEGYDLCNKLLRM